MSYLATILDDYDGMDIYVKTNIDIPVYISNMVIPHILTMPIFNKDFFVEKAKQLTEQDFVPSLYYIQRDFLVEVYWIFNDPFHDFED